MRCARVLFPATLFCLFLSPAAAAQDDTTAAPTVVTQPDTVYLKDGRVFIGRIVDSMPSQGSLVIRLRDGRDIVVSRAQMARAVRVISYAVPAPPTPTVATQPDTIYLRDGRVFIGRIVDSLPSQGSLVIRLRDDGRDMVVTRAQMARVARVIPPEIPAPPPVPQRVTVVDRDGQEISSTVITPTPVRQPAGKKKSPALSWFLSFLVPGAGQFYNGQWEKGAGFMLVQIVTAATYMHQLDACEIQSPECNNVRIAVLVGFVNWIVTQVDAPVSATALNKKNGYTLDLRPQPHALGLSLARLRF
jgi:hypothetical protein